MTQITVVRMIDAPVQLVFDTLADARRYAEAIPDVTAAEYLTQTTRGVGARYRQTRLVQGRPTDMEFEVTEFEPAGRLRIVNETHGTVWDSVFELGSSEGVTTLTLRMEARPGSMFQRLFLSLLMPLVIRQAVRKDIDLLAEHCEAFATGT